MTAADDAVVLAVLDAVANLNVHDGDVPDSDPATMVITAALPYVLFYAMADDPEVGDNLAGTSGAYLTGFQVTFVGESREQAKWAGEKARGVLDRKRLAFPAGSRFVRLSDPAPFVGRDDTWTRPGGAPLFIGQDRYTVAI